MSTQILNARQPQAQERDPKTLSIGVFGHIDPSVVDYLAGHHVVRQEAPAGFELKSVISELDGIVIRSPFRLNDECALVASRLKWIIRAGAGTDNISPIFNSKGVSVRTTPISVDSVAELVVGLTLGLLRSIRPAHDSLRQGLWKKQSFIGGELRGKTVGILGYGRIGRQVSRLMRGFGTRIVAFDRSPDVADKRRAAEETDARLMSMEAVFDQADIIVACLPGSHETRHLLNRERFSQLRRGAFLVNVGRGSLIELSALESALDSGHLAGVALDAYEVEPPGHMAIFDRDNVLCTPHLGAQTQEAQKAVGAGVIAHLRSLLNQ